MLCHGSQQANLIGSQFSRRFAIKDDGTENARLGLDRQYAEETQLGVLRGTSGAQSSIAGIGFNIFKNHWLAGLNDSANHTLASLKGTHLGPVLRVGFERSSQLHLLHFRVEKKDSSGFKLENTGNLVDDCLQDC